MQKQRQKLFCDDQQILIQLFRESVEVGRGSVKVGSFFFVLFFYLCSNLFKSFHSAISPSLMVSFTSLEIDICDTSVPLVEDGDEDNGGVHVLGKWAQGG